MSMHANFTNVSNNCLHYARTLNIPPLRRQLGEHATHDIAERLDPGSIGMLVTSRLQVIASRDPELMTITSE